MSDDVLEIFSLGIGGSIYDTTKEHPRLGEYKGRFFKSGEQQNRRREYLEQQKKNRFDAVSYARKLADGDLNEEDFTQATMEVEEFSKCEKQKNKKRFNPYKNQLMLSEWLVDAPPDLESDWIMMLSPVGKRVLIVAHKGSTSAYSKNGYCLNKFPSLLPGGSFKSWHSSAKQSFTLLDCIYDEVNRTFWILDLMFYKGVCFYESEKDFRLFWITTMLLEDSEDLNQNTEANPFKFLPCPHVSCSETNIFNILAKPHDFQIDGVLFYHRLSQYRPGRNPLVGWLKPYMIPDILGIEVPVINTNDAPVEFNRDALMEANKKLQKTMKDTSFVVSKSPKSDISMK
ncbi:snurportin-1 isoform X1 [Hydra vulgaris]|uniref:Snurportin-1 n=1 Tax=Hydra vulgaris TaxID=6087 RepID=T2MID7_HYDVU|nr:snurportin-1 [Hydra vulgaris]